MDSDSVHYSQVRHCLFCISSTLLWFRPSPTIVPYRARKHRSLMSVMFALLLLSGNVESNPRPASSSFNLGVWNVRSAVNKTAPIHNTIMNFRLDALALSETWIQEDDPPLIKCDPAPPGLQHCPYSPSNGPLWSMSRRWLGNCLSWFNGGPPSSTFWSSEAQFIRTPAR